MGSHVTALETLYRSSQYFILFYFAFINLTYIVLGYLGLRATTLHTHRLSKFALKNLLERNAYQPISILVPAYNEEKSIVACVKSFLNLHYPTFEVIVVSDGSRDRTVEVLIDAYKLVEMVYGAYPQTLSTQPVKRIFHSLRAPNLVVIEKENGGKADALNAALNLARYPIVSTVDADSVLNVEALLSTVRLFVEDESVVAVGAVVRPLNGATIENGQIRNLRIPTLWIERLQILEYIRAFFMGRMGWAALDSLLIISGAFGLFKREAVLEVGGYSANTVGEDIELVVRIHRYYRGQKRPYRVLFNPEVTCLTEAPSDMATLRRQRNRWHRGLWETLWTHRGMFLNPRYGRLGLIAIPYLWLVDGLSPLIELAGYISLPINFYIGIFSPEFAFWFLLLAFLQGALLSQMGVGTEILLLKNYSWWGDRVILLILGVVEFFGYRQILVMERALSTFQVWRKRGQWGTMKRKGIR